MLNAASRRSSGTRASPHLSQLLLRPSSPWRHEELRGDPSALQARLDVPLLSQGFEVLNCQTSWDPFSPLTVFPCNARKVPPARRETPRQQHSTPASLWTSSATAHRRLGREGARHMVFGSWVCGTCCFGRKCGRSRALCSLNPLPSRTTFGLGMRRDSYRQNLVLRHRRFTPVATRRSTHCGFLLALPQLFLK